MKWIRSSFPCGAESACVEVARTGRQVWVRNSNGFLQPMLGFTDEEWAAFVGGVKAGEFDVDRLS